MLRRAALVPAPAAAAPAPRGLCGRWGPGLPLIASPAGRLVCDARTASMSLVGGLAPRQGVGQLQVKRSCRRPKCLQARDLSTNSDLGCRDVLRALQVALAERACLQHAGHVLLMRLADIPRTHGTRSRPGFSLPLSQRSHRCGLPSRRPRLPHRCFRGWAFSPAPSLRNSSHQFLSSWRAYTRWVQNEMLQNNQTTSAWGRRIVCVRKCGSVRSPGRRAAAMRRRRRSAWQGEPAAGGSGCSLLGGGQVALLHALPVDQVLDEAAAGRGETWSRSESCTKLPPQKQLLLSTPRPGAPNPAGTRGLCTKCA